MSEDLRFVRLIKCTSENSLLTAQFSFKPNPLAAQALCMAIVYRGTVGCEIDSNKSIENLLDWSI